MAKKLYKSFGYKAIQIVVLTLYSILLIPILLNFWDLEVYGAWIAIYAFFNLIQVLELGHSMYVGNEFNFIVHNDSKAAKRVLGSALRGNILIGGLQLVVVAFLYVTGLFDYILDAEVSSFEAATVLGVLFLYRMTMGSFRGLVVKALNPFGLIYKAFQFNLIEKILEFGVLCSAAFLDLSLLQLAIVWFVVKFAYSSIVLFQIRNLLPEFYPWWRYGSFKHGFQNVRKSFAFVGSNFLDRLGNDGIVLVVSALMGSTFLPLFSATRTIVNFGLKLSDFFLAPLAPEMINLYAKKRKKQLMEIFKGYWLMTGGILMLGFTLSLFFIEPLFTLWTNDTLQFSMLLYCALIIIFLVQNHGKVLYSFFMGINRTRLVLMTSLLRILLFFGVVLSFQEYGLNAVLGALFVAELIIAGAWLPIATYKEFEVSNRQKIFLYNNLISVLLLALLYGLFLMDSNLIFLIAIYLIIIILQGIQFYQISADSRRKLAKNFQKLVTFARKGK
ncbi:hypothetical protein MG296_13715 [Flavobacteriaceae bacterium TK19130]|nr:hypothetical protein [Thermobacterium salinum]